MPQELQNLNYIYAVNIDNMCNFETCSIFAFCRKTFNASQLKIYIHCDMKIYYIHGHEKNKIRLGRRQVSS